MPINTNPHIHKNVVCANIFIRKDDKYIVMKRSAEKKFAPNVVHPFGGKVDQNENPFEAPVREVKEETGISVKNVKLEAVILEINPPASLGYNWLIFHFSADYDSGEVIETEEGELHTMTKEEIKSSELFPSVKEVIDHILNQDDETVFITVQYGNDGNVISSRSKKFLCGN